MYRLTKLLERLIRRPGHRILLIGMSIRVRIGRHKLMRSICCRVVMIRWLSCWKIGIRRRLWCSMRRIGRSEIRWWKWPWLRIKILRLSPLLIFLSALLRKSLSVQNMSPMIYLTPYSLNNPSSKWIHNKYRQKSRKLFKWLLPALMISTNHKAMTSIYQNR